jgi:hypothetical protein
MVASGRHPVGRISRLMPDDDQVGNSARQGLATHARTDRS